MFYRFSQTFLLVALILSVSALAVGQDTSESILPKLSKSDDYPKNFKEALEKMRINKEKKEYQEMLDRGEEVLKITEDLEKTVEQTGRLSERDYAKIASVEKLVKKIRGDLGGNDDKDDKALRAEAQRSRLSPEEAVRSLRSATATMIDELKKTTRFSISAAAIQSSNAVLSVARFLRFAN